MVLMNSLGSPLQLATSVPTDVTSFARRQSGRGNDVLKSIKTYVLTF